MLEQASAVVQEDPFRQLYETCPPASPQLYSLHHTFPRFKRKGVALWFVIVPSDDCHLECEPANFERSEMGLPYPKLEIFAQSLLATNSMVALTDLIDGMDLTE